MSDSDATRREGEPDKYGSGRDAGDDPAPVVVSKGSGEPPSMFVQIVGAVAIGLLAVVAAQGFLTARDVSVVSQNVGALAGRLQAESEKSRKLFDEVVILRGQVGEVREDRVLEPAHAIATRLGREVQPTRLTTRQRQILQQLGFNTPAQILSRRLPRAP